MRTLRSRFEDKVLLWPKVTTKKMFGCPCYKANGNLFAFLATNGIVVTRLSQTEREKLPLQYRANEFQAGKKNVKNWIRIQVKNETDLELVIPIVKRSYQSALSIR